MTIDDQIDSKLSDIRHGLYAMYKMNSTQLYNTIDELITKVEQLQDFVIENSEE